MPVTLDAVHDHATSLPDVTVGTSWGQRTWGVRGKAFAWVRPLRKADLERLGDTPPPPGDIIGVRTDGLDAKDALLAMGLPGFFTIEHFNGYPAVLVALKQARAKDVRAAITDAYRVVEKKKAAKKPAAKPRRPRAKRAR